MTTPTTKPTTILISYRIPKKEKQYVNDVINHVSDHYTVDGKAKAFLKLLSLYMENFTDEILPDETNVREILLRINCDFLIHEAPMFVCSERFHAKKKVDDIGKTSKIVIARCAKCEIGKEHKRRKNIENLLTKQGIKKLIDLHKSLAQLTQRGLDINAYCCASILFQEGKLIVSQDGLRLPCIYEDNEIISISQVCKERLNEKTKAPPCAFLIDLLVRGYSKDIEDIAKQYEETLRQLPEQIEADTQEPKIVDAEVTIISDDNGDEESDEKKDDEEKD